jgi:DNA-binding MarR family transcriptional regulator
MTTKTKRTETALALVLNVFRLANVLGQAGNRLAGTYGLTAQQWLALTSIGIGGERGVTPTEIGRNSLVSPQNVTGLLDRLELAGYVQRAPDGDDRRSFRVRLTGEGARVFHALNPLGSAWAQQAAAELPWEKVELLCGLLEEYLGAATKAAFVNGRPGKFALPLRGKKRIQPEKAKRSGESVRGLGRTRRRTVG